MQQTIANDLAANNTRYRLAARAIVFGNFETALQQLLKLMRRYRHHSDDTGRKGLLKAFEKLGDSGELVELYCRQMFNILH